MRSIVAPIIKRLAAPFRERLHRRLAESQRKIDYMRMLVLEQRARREMDERFSRLRARLSRLEGVIDQQERTITKLEAEMDEIEYEMDSSANRAARAGGADGGPRSHDDDPSRRLEVLPDGTVRRALARSTCIAQNRSGDTQMLPPPRPRWRPHRPYQRRGVRSGFRSGWNWADWARPGAGWGTMSAWPGWAGSEGGRIQGPPSAPGLVLTRPHALCASQAGHHGAQGDAHSVGGNRGGNSVQLHRPG